VSSCVRVQVHRPSMPAQVWALGRSSCFSGAAYDVFMVPQIQAAGAQANGRCLASGGECLPGQATGSTGARKSRSEACREVKVRECRATRNVLGLCRQ